MKYIYLFLLFIYTNTSIADDTIRFDESIAIERARVELKEFAFISGYEINEKYLNGDAKVLAAKTQDGIPIIKVLFNADKGTYEVIFSIDKDGWLERRGVGDNAYSVEKIEKEFKENPSFYLY